MARLNEAHRRVLRVLDERRHRRIRDIAAAAGRTQAPTHATLRTLEARGLAQQDPAGWVLDPHRTWVRNVAGDLVGDYYPIGEGPPAIRPVEEG